MNLAALQHVVQAATALADDCRVVVLGSASLLVSFPRLGDAGMPLETTFDADLCPEPADELVGRMLERALGEDGPFRERHGYHIDVLRTSIFETLPDGWRGRVIPVPDCLSAVALDPHDLAATKLLVGRQKDLALLQQLVSLGLLDADTTQARLSLIRRDEKQIVRSAANFRAVFNS